MEDIVQRVFAILMSVFMFFILPLYIAFEKKDDIAYALALKITNSFVENVNSKGYLTLEMYEEYISELSTTGNVYDISLEYTAKEYNPIIQVYHETSEGKVIDKEYDYLEKKTEYEQVIKRDKTVGENFSVYEENTNVELTYKLSEVKYTTKQILDLLGSGINNRVSVEDYDDYANIDKFPLIPRTYGLKNEGVLLMNEGDLFTVVAKNTNTTFATVLFNTLTFGANSGNDTKVYINYGGTIKNIEWMPQMIGDINEDGKVDKKDRDIIEKIKDPVLGLSELATLTLRQKIAADVNSDGIINDNDWNDIVHIYSLPETAGI